MSVTCVPPAVGPDTGKIEETVGVPKLNRDGTAASKITADFSPRPAPVPQLPPVAPLKVVGLDLQQIR